MSAVYQSTTASTATTNGSHRHQQQPQQQLRQHQSLDKGFKAYEFIWLLTMMIKNPMNSYVFDYDDQDPYEKKKTHKKQKVWTALQGVPEGSQ